MADPWKHLFDNDLRRREDIDTTSARIGSTQADVDGLRARVKDAEVRADRLELVLEGLLTYLEASGTLDREGLAVWTARLDLADGVEDGRLGPDRASRAPSCASCGRPANPKRDACLYCGAAISADTPPPVRVVDCRACGQTVPETQVYFTERGMVCGSCYVP